MNIKITTWANASEDLFDFTSSNAARNLFKTSLPGTIISEDEKITFSSDNYEEKGRELCKISIHDGVYAVYPVNQLKNLSKTQCNRLWLVINKIQPVNEYRICEGDIIRLGRIKIKVKEINLEGNSSPTRIKSILSIDSMSEDDCIQSDFMCRICLSEYYTHENPLVSPCSCDGTMKHIHLHCLQRYISSKLVSKSTAHTVSISYKKVSCDLCKKKFPESILIEDIIMPTISIPRPQGKYLILESCGNSKNSKDFHVVCFNSIGQVNIGRSNYCDIKINDICASRNHAVLKYSNGAITLKDNNSKFGSLVEIKRPLKIEKNKKLAVQTGKSMIVFNVKKPWSFFPSCFSTNGNAYDVFKANGQSSAMPLLPFNTGIPLSMEFPIKSKLQNSDCDDLNHYAANRVHTLKSPDKEEEINENHEFRIIETMA